jgi:hypothetical protein
MNTRSVLVSLIVWGVVACGSSDGPSGPVDYGHHCTQNADCTTGACDPNRQTCTTFASYLEDCTSGLCYGDSACSSTVVGHVCTHGCAKDDECSSGVCVEGQCVPRCEGTSYGYAACLDGRPLACSDPVAQEIACNVCGCPEGRTCLSSICTMNVTPDVVGQLPEGREVSAMAVGDARIFVGSSRSFAQGDVFVLAKGGGDATTFAADVGGDPHLAVNRDEIAVLAVVAQTTDHEPIYRLERVRSNGTRVVLLENAGTNCSDVAFGGTDVYYGCTGLRHIADRYHSYVQRVPTATCSACPSWVATTIQSRE